MPAALHAYFICPVWQESVLPHKVVHGSVSCFDPEQHFEPSTYLFVTFCKLADSL